MDPFGTLLLVLWAALAVAFLLLAANVALAVFDALSNRL